MALTGKQLEELLSTVKKTGSETTLPSVASKVDTKADSIKSLTNQVSNLSTRMAAVGEDAKKVTDTRNPLEKILNLTPDQNFVFDLFELINRPQQALFGALEAGAQGGNAFEGAITGLTGENKTGFKDVLKAVTNSELGDVAGQVDLVDIAGLAGDVLLDPADLALMFVSGGTSLAGSTIATGKDLAKEIEAGLDIAQIGKGLAGGMGEVTDLVKVANDASPALGKVQDLLFGQGKRLVTNLSFDDYVSAVVSSKARTKLGLEGASLTSMTMKTLGGTVKGLTHFSDAAFTNGFKFIDDTGELSKAYASVKQAYANATSGLGKAIKGQVGLAQEKYNTVMLMLKGVDTRYIDYVDKLAKRTLPEGKLLGDWFNELNVKIMDRFEKEYATNLLDADAVLDFMAGKTHSLFYSEDTLSDLFDVFGRENIEPYVAIKTLPSGVKYFEFDSKVFSEDNGDFLMQMKDKAKQPRTVFDKKTRKAYEKTLMYTDDVRYEQYRQKVVQYENGLDSRVAARYTKETGLEATEMTRKGRGWKEVKAKVEAEDLKMGLHPQKDLLDPTLIKDRYNAYLTVEERAAHLEALSPSDQKAYKDLLDYQKTVLVPALSVNGKLSDIDKMKLDKQADNLLRFGTTDVSSRIRKLDFDMGKVYDEASVSKVEASLQKAIDTAPTPAADYAAAKRAVDLTNDGTYDLITGAEKSYPDGYQISFETTQGLADDALNSTVEGLKKQLGVEPDIGVFDGKAEISFHVNDKDTATAIMKKFNQQSMVEWDPTAKYGVNFINNPWYNPATNVVSGATMSKTGGMFDGSEFNNKLLKAQRKGRIRMGHIENDVTKAYYDSIMNDDTLKEGAEKFKDYLHEAQRAVGMREFNDAEALIKAGFQGYATHGLNQAASDAFEAIKQAHPEWQEKIDFSMFMPGKTKALAARQMYGNVYETNMFLKEWYGEMFKNDAWIKEQFKDANPEFLDDLKKYFTTNNLLAQESTASMFSFIDDSYSAINKNNKTNQMLLATSVGNVKAPGAAFQLVSSTKDVPSGFVPMNKGDVYRTIRTLEANMKFAGENKLTRDLVNALKSTTSNVGMQVPVVEKHIYEMLKVTNELKPKDMLKFIDTINSGFKVGKTLNPAFNVKNITGHMVNQWLAGMPMTSIFSGWNNAWRLRKEMVALDEVIIEGGMEALTAEQRVLYDTYQEFLDAGFLSRSSIYKLNDLDPNNRWTDPMTSQKKFTATDNIITRANMDLNLKNDNAARLSTYLYAKRHPEFVAKLGIDITRPDAAMQAVRLIHFDPNDLTFFEDDIMKRLVPFYTFTRQNMAFQIKNLTRHSEKYNKLFKLYNSWNSNVMDLAPEEMQKYQRDQFYIPVWKKENGEYVAIKSSIPVAALSEITFGAKDLTQNVVSKLTPAVRAPFEMATGTQTFTGQPIERYKGELSTRIPLPYMTKSMEWLLSQTGLDVPTAAVAQTIKAGADIASGASPEKAIYKATNLLGTINPQDTQITKLYNDLDNLNARVQVLKSKGVELPTLDELSKNAQGDKASMQMTELQKINDLINNIKR